MTGVSHWSWRRVQKVRQFSGSLEIYWPLKTWNWTHLLDKLCDFMESKRSKKHPTIPVAQFHSWEHKSAIHSLLWTLTENLEFWCHHQVPLLLGTRFSWIGCCFEVFYSETLDKWGGNENKNNAVVFLVIIVINSQILLSKIVKLQMCHRWQQVFASSAV